LQRFHALAIVVWLHNGQKASQSGVKLRICQWDQEDGQLKLKTTEVLGEDVISKGRKSQKIMQKENTTPT
jgi:hypothetical protein